MGFLSNALPHRVSILVVIILSFFLNSCTASSPRFRTRDDSAKKTADRQSRAGASREAEEESKENDKPVDVAGVLPDLDKTSVPNSGIDRRKVMDEIRAMIGTPYAFSGTGSKGIDCSGFTAKIYREALDKQLPHSTSDQFAASRFVEDSDRMFGDLLFFNTTGESPSHVGIYLGQDLFAHASVSSGVTISSLESSYYKKRYLEARRVIP